MKKKKEIESGLRSKKWFMYYRYYSVKSELVKI